ncbi:MAG TPA: pilus assembly protein TadG-related protein [Gemmataceae bacterium]|nr:pilus assembly protein TadG-related protein [Gemmataceae bacterium]
MLYRRRAPRRGIVAVVVVLGLTVLLGVAAVTLDGGTALAQRRRAQAAADAAALAAAADLFKNYPANAGKDTGGTARTSALAIASANGFSNDGTTSVVTVNIPPTSGTFSGQDGYAEVIVQYNLTRTFSAIFGPGAVPIQGRAVARGQWVPSSPGLLVLDYGGKGTLNIQGGGALTESGSAIYVNSNDPKAVIDTGTGTLKATEIDIVGSLAVGNKATLITSPTPNNVVENVPPMQDPLASLPAPTPPGLGSISSTPLTGGGTQYVLTPGQYGGPGPTLPNFGNKDVVILKQASAGNGGIYYLNSGGFNFQGASLTMDTGTSGGVMFYNAGTGTNDKFNITGSATGTVNLSGLTSGTYQGMIFFQSRTAPEDVQIAGNGSFTINGTLYAADATLKVAGNGGTSSIGSQWIAKDVAISGNGNVNLTYNASTVARMRVYGLVE